MELTKAHGNVLRILVLGVGGDVSIGILKCLKNFSGDTFILGACVHPFAAGYSLCDEAIKCPYAIDPEFESWLKKTITQYHISIIISGVEEIIQELAKFDKLPNDCLALVPPRHYLEVFSSKLATAEWFKERKLGFPKTLQITDDVLFEDLRNELGLPFIIKPIYGKASKGVQEIRTLAEFEALRDRNKFIAQELIGDHVNEYTCGVYKSKYNYTKILILKRSLINGSTKTAQVVNDPTIHQYCMSIAEQCDVYVPFNIQLRMCSDRRKPYCFEINMRLSGTTAIRHGFGFPDCVIWIKENYFNTSFVGEFNVVPGFVSRFENEVFFDKDGNII